MTFKTYKTPAEARAAFMEAMGILSVYVNN